MQATVESTGRAPDAREVLQPFMRRALIELGPALLFFGVFFWSDSIMTATAAFMVAVAASVTISGIEKRQVPLIPMISAGIVLTLGGLTLVLESEIYIKVYPTVSNGLFALALAGAQIYGVNVLKRSFGEELRIGDSAWNTILWRIVIYLLALAVINEIVWRGFSTEAWVIFKTFVKVPANLVFAIVHIRFVRRNWRNGQSGG